MKILKVLVTTFVLSLLFLAGCNKSEEAVNVERESDNGAVDFSDMTEDERIQEMIKMIEAKQAEMK
jgi:hypothetical protein